MNSTWLKSSYSGGDINNCVELRVDGQRVSIRDSKCAVATLTVPSPAWQSFLFTVRGTSGR